MKIRKLSPEEIKDLKWSTKIRNKRKYHYLGESGYYSDPVVSIWPLRQNYLQVRFFDRDVMIIKERPTRELHKYVYDKFIQYHNAHLNLSYREFYEKENKIRVMIQAGNLGLSYVDDWMNGRGTINGWHQTFANKIYGKIGRAEIRQVEEYLKTIIQAFHDTNNEFGGDDDNINLSDCELFVRPMIRNEYKEQEECTYVAEHTYFK